MTTVEEVAAEYKSSLADLTSNSKPLINMLTMLAEEGAEHGSTIVKVIVSHIQQVPSNQKLPALYLVDSIIKNCPDDTHYKELVAPYIITTFINVFQTGDEKVRAALYKLRLTWNNIFTPARLYGIDIKAHGIDPQWPIVAAPHATRDATVSDSAPAKAKPVDNSKNIHVNPKFLKQQAPAPRLSESERQLQELQQKRQELAKKSETPEKSKRVPQSVVTVARDPRKAAKAAANATGPPEEEKTRKKRRSNESESKKQSDSSSSRKGRKDLLTRYREESAQEGSGSESQTNDQSPSHSQKRKGNRNYRKPNSSWQEDSSNVFEEQTNRLNDSDDRTAREQSPSEVLIKRKGKDIDLRKEKRLPPKKRRTLESETSSRDSQSDDGEPNEKRPKERPADEDLREHRSPPQDKRRDLHNNRRMGGSRPPYRNTGPTSRPGRHAFEPESGLLPTPHMQRPPYLRDRPPARPPPYAYEREPFFGPAPPPPGPPLETLDPIPANNRIFVDGIAYEVQYVQDVPVIERNGLPHKIYFTGPPRNVIIDGVSHSLAFGDKKTITIDGQPHVIRFGAPSRELYMGSYPFRGAFGGPPIFATINGIRHEIRLGGPPPEVKIEPESCYELLRYMPNQQVGPKFDYGSSAPEQTTGSQGALDVAGLLAKIQQSGIMKQISALTHSQSSATSAEASHSQSPARPTTPPVPSAHHLRDDEVVPRDMQPPPNLKDFSMRALKVRYQGVIDNLYQTKQRCPNCGLRFDSLDSLKYARHLDWHFKENRKAQDSTRGMSRAWYFAVEDWINYTEQGDDPASKAKSAVFEGDIDSQPTSEQNGHGTIENALAPADSHDQSCEVCGEPFESFWDEDAEDWMLRNAVGVNGKFYHPLCFQDVTSTSPLPTTADTSAFILTDTTASYSGALPGLEVSVPEEQPSEEPEVKTEPEAEPIGDDTVVGGELLAEQQGLCVQVKQEPILDGDSAHSPGTPLRDEETGSPGTPLRDEVE